MCEKEHWTQGACGSEVNRQGFYSNCRRSQRWILACCKSLFSATTVRIHWKLPTGQPPALAGTTEKQSRPGILKKPATNKTLNNIYLLVRKSDSLDDQKLDANFDLRKVLSWVG